VRLTASRHGLIDSLKLLSLLLEIYPKEDVPTALLNGISFSKIIEIIIQTSEVAPQFPISAESRYESMKMRW
jgi:hypothetical protein